MLRDVKSMPEHPPQGWTKAFDASGKDAVMRLTGVSVSFRAPRISRAEQERLRRERQRSGLAPETRPDPRMLQPYGPNDRVDDALAWAHRYMLQTWQPEVDADARAKRLQLTERRLLFSGCVKTILLVTIGRKAGPAPVFTQCLIFGRLRKAGPVLMSLAGFEFS